LVTTSFNWVFSRIFAFIGFAVHCTPPDKSAWWALQSGRRCSGGSGDQLSIRPASSSTGSDATPTSCFQILLPVDPARHWHVLVLFLSPCRVAFRQRLSIALELEA
jgi:hypothetical protein